MKKFFALAVAGSASLVLMVPVAQAQVTSTFNAVINLTSACVITTAPGDVTFNYTSFQGGASTPSTSFAVQCTNTRPYTMALTTTAGGGSANVTDDAVNLAYTLALSAAGGTGSGTPQTYNINGTMASGQSGTCSAASCTNAAATNRGKTLTVTF